MSAEEKEGCVPHIVDHMAVFVVDKAGNIKAMDVMEPWVTKTIMSVLLMKQVLIHCSRQGSMFQKGFMHFGSHF